MHEKAHYPKFKYHAEKPARIVASKEEEMRLGADWVDSPAELGTETNPGIKPDAAIVAKRVPAAPTRAPKKAGA